MKCRWLSILLVLAVLVGSLPLPGTAVEADNLCEHHGTHTEECGYQPPVDAAPCAHICDQSCVQTQTHCIHSEHAPECYALGEDGMPISEDPVNCVHTECSVESGCVTEEQLCVHSEHDEQCGYRAASEEQPCRFVCSLCNTQAATPDEASLCGHGIEEDCSLCSIEAQIAVLPNAEELVRLSTADPEAYAAGCQSIQAAADAYFLLSESDQAQITNREILQGLLSALEASSAGEEAAGNVCISSLYLSSSEIPLNSSITITVETVGEGTCSFEYVVWQKQENGDFVEADSVTSQEPVFVYTPTAQGIYYVDVTAVSGGQESQGRTEQITVYGGLWLKELKKIGDGNPHYTFQAIPAGEGSVQSVVFEVLDYITEESLGISQEGTSYVYSFTLPENATKANYLCRVTLIDGAGNRSTKDLIFRNLTGNGLQIFQSSTSEEYLVGESVTFTVKPLADITVASVDYRIYEAQTYSLVQSLEATTELSYTFQTTQCGNFHCSVEMTDTNGNTHSASRYFSVIEEDFVFTALTATPDTVAPGEIIDFSCQVSHPERVESVSCYYFTPDGTEIELYRGTELAWRYTYTSESYLSNFRVYAQVKTTSGATYKASAEISVTNDLPCTIQAVSASQQHFLPGEEVAIHVTLGGSEQFQLLEYRITNTGNGHEEVFFSTEPDLVYTPKENGRYSISVVLTQTDGTTTVYDSRLSYFTVTNVYAQDIPGWDQVVDLSLGESYTCQIPTVGDGNIAHIQYKIYCDPWDGTFADTIVHESTDTSFTFQPAKPGSYHIRATLFNEEGYSFYISSPALWVHEGIYLTGLTASAETVSLGEPVTFVPETQGEGAFQSLRYEITWHTADSPDFLTTTIDKTLEPFTWFPDKAGSYYITAAPTNASGEISGRSIWTTVLVTGEMAPDPVEPPADSPQAPGSLAGEEAAWAAEGKDVEITVNTIPVEKDTTDPEQQLLTEAAGEKQLEIMDISVYKDEAGTVNALPETKTVLEIRVPCRYEGKTSLSVYRIHNGVCQTLRRLAAKPDALEDGTYYADVVNGYLYIYASQFCKFGIAYLTAPAAPNPEPAAPGGTAAPTIIWGSASDNPPTGDLIMVPVVTMLVSGMILWTLFLERKKLLLHRRNGTD